MALKTDFADIVIFGVKFGFCDPIIF